MEVVVNFPEVRNLYKIRTSKNSKLHSVIAVLSTLTGYATNELILKQNSVILDPSINVEDAVSVDSSLECSVASPVIPTPRVDFLVAQGFQQKDAQIALISTGNDLEAALSILSRCSLNKQKDGPQIQLLQNPQLIPNPRPNDMPLIISRNSQTDTKSKHWTEEEEQLLDQKMIEYNNKWQDIHPFFPNRVPHAVKAKIHRKLKEQGMLPKSAPQAEDEINISQNSPQ